VNWDRMEGQWKQQRGIAVYHWGKMMNDELSAILGKNEELVGKLQEKYGIAKEEAKRQVDEFRKIQWQSHEISKVPEQKGEVKQKNSRCKEGIEEKIHSKKGECKILIVRQPLFVR